MGHSVKRRRVADKYDALDDLDSDDDLTLADLDASDQRAKQVKLKANNGRRLLHRRQVVVTVDLTVAVADTVTVAVGVDSDGIPTTTVSLPSVPSVPAFPSDLTVPAVPAVPTESLPAVPSVPPLSSTLVAATATNSNTQAILASPPATPLPETTAATNGTSAPASITSSASPFATFSAPFNGETFYFTITARPAPNSLIASSIASTGMTSNMLIASNSSAAALSTGFLGSNSSLFGATNTTMSSTFATSILSGSLSSSGSPTTATGVAGGAGSGSGQTGSSPTGSGSSGSGSNNNGSNNNGAPPPGLVAGAVTGSVGGAAIILLILVILVRWLRRRNSALPRDESSVTGLRPDNGSGPGMSQRTILPAAAAGALARISTMARPKSSPTLPPSEQGFQKLTGRKMPSQFGSEFDHGPMAMDFATSAAGRPQRNTADTNLSDTSFYRESQSFFGGLGESPERPAGPLAGFAGPSTQQPRTAPSPESMRPSPARTPVIHQGGPWSSTSTQGPPTTAGTGTLNPRQADSSTLGRSLYDGSHSTRFTEEL